MWCVCMWWWWWWWGAAIVYVRLSSAVQVQYKIHILLREFLLLGQKKKNPASLLVPFRLEVSYLVQNLTFLYMTFPSDWC